MNFMADVEPAPRPTRSQVLAHAQTLLKAMNLPSPGEAIWDISLQETIEWRDQLQARFDKFIADGHKPYL